jgi:aryl-alcohol dehydrogenase-like predicted oxidoreductase
MSPQLTLQKRPLGKTGILVTPVGLGMMEFSGGGSLLGLAFPPIPQADKNAIVKAGLDGGINWFDTAEMYGGGVSERSLATALRAASMPDGEVVVATKWSPILRTARSIGRTIDARLRFLEGYSIGLYMVHQPHGLSSPEAEMDAMADLVAAGKIRSVGVSNFSAERMRRAHAALQRRGIPLAANQVRYSLLHREIETDGILDTARELGVTIIAYTPLGSGALSGKYQDDPASLRRLTAGRRWLVGRDLARSRAVVPALRDIAEQHGVTAAQVALNWLIHAQGEIVVTIPGVTKIHQAQESAGAMGFRLTEEELAQLNRLTQDFRRPA